MVTFVRKLSEEGEGPKRKVTPTELGGEVSLEEAKQSAFEIVRDLEGQGKMHEALTKRSHLINPGLITDIQTHFMTGLKSLIIESSLPIKGNLTQGEWDNTHESDARAFCDNHNIKGNIIYISNDAVKAIREKFPAQTRSNGM